MKRSTNTAPRGGVVAAGRGRVVHFLPPERGLPTDELTACSIVTQSCSDQRAHVTCERCKASAAFAQLDQVEAGGVSGLRVVPMHGWTGRRAVVDPDGGAVLVAPQGNDRANLLLAADALDQALGNDQPDPQPEPEADPVDQALAELERKRADYDRAESAAAWAKASAAVAETAREEARREFWAASDRLNAACVAVNQAQRAAGGAR
jgi:hypothetical protein